MTRNSFAGTQGNLPLRTSTVIQFLLAVFLSLASCVAFMLPAPQLNRFLPHANGVSRRVGSAWFAVNRIPRVSFGSDIRPKA